MEAALTWAVIITAAVISGEVIGRFAHRLLKPEQDDNIEMQMVELDQPEIDE